jgi:hypothetical protein
MTMVRTRHKPSPARINTHWTHQIALPDDLCCQPNFALIWDWFKARGMQPMTLRVQAIWPDRRYINYRLHCFQQRADAEAFQAHFGGQWFDPKKDREGGSNLGAWRRTDEYHRIIESGPLKTAPVYLRGPGNMEYD